MKYKLLTLIMAVLLISVAVAGIGNIISTDRTIPSSVLNSTEKTTLNSFNINSWDYVDSEISDSVIRTLDFGNNRFHKIEIFRYYSTCLEWETKESIYIGEDNVAINLTENIKCLDKGRTEKTSEEKTAELDRLEELFMKDLAKTIDKIGEVETVTRDGSVVIGR